MTEVITNLPESSTSVETDSAPSEQQETFRGRLRRGAQEFHSVLDLSAGAALNRIDARAHTDTMESLNNRYNGLLERRSASDRISATLQSDIQLDFRRDAQRAGFIDIYEMPTDQRQAIAETAVATYLDDIIAELQGHHPDWTSEQIDELALQYAQDIASILSMDREDHDTYLSAMLEYQESRSALAQLETEKTELQEQRNQHLRNFGRIALQTLVAMAHSVRNAPYTIGSHASAALVQVREWYGNRSAEGKKTVLFSAAGVAVAGIVAYIATRHTGNAPQGNYTLASYTDTLGHPTGLGTGHPGALGMNHPTGLGGNALLHPTGLGANSAHPAGLGVNQHPAGLGGNTLGHPSGLGGNTHPTGLGGNAHPAGLGGNNHPSGLGSNHPGGLGGAKHPNGLGRNHPSGLGNGPDVIGNPNGQAINTSHDLFVGSGDIDKWPDTITVSHWNSKTHDGSCWGIAEQMLHRSGVNNPTDAQIQQISDALRPQAQLPNGFLMNGQKLHLGPALDAIKNLS